MSRQVSPAANRPYGVLRVAGSGARHEPRSIGIGNPTRQRRRQRPARAGPMPDAALVDAIRELLAEQPLPR